MPWLPRRRRPWLVLMAVAIFALVSVRWSLLAIAAAYSSTAVVDGRTTAAAAAAAPMVADVEQGREKERRHAPVDDTGAPLPVLVLRNSRMRVEVAACSGGKSFRLGSVQNLQAGGARPWVLDSPLFHLETWEGVTADSDACEVTETHAGGLPAQLVLEFSCPRDLRFRWKAVLEPGSAYLLHELQYSWQHGGLSPKFLWTTQLSAASAVRSIGSGFGSILFNPEALAFTATEHPAAANGRIDIGPEQIVTGLLHVAPLAQGEMSVPLSTVLGVVTEASQLRRDFHKTYLENRRARPPKSVDQQ